MRQATIPEHIKRWADAVIKEFNERVVRDPNRYYIARYRGRYLYLDRSDYGGSHRISRLAYTGSSDQWEFAIFKYSDERYDADEWLFPGSGYVDGTLEGALNAGLEAYP
jgi:hypothetical protein